MKKKLIAGILAAGMSVSLLGCGGSEGGTEKSSTESGSEAGGNEGGAITAQADENGNYVLNGSFEEADFTGWTINNVDNTTEELDIYTRETDCSDGVQSLHFYSSSSDVNFTAEQTLTGLEEGTYKLTGSIQGDAGGDPDASIYFYAVIDGETVKADTSLNGYLAWNTAELDGLNVTGGEITVGVSVTTAPGGWGTIDGITLVKE